MLTTTYSKRPSSLVVIDMIGSGPADEGMAVKVVLSKGHSLGSLMPTY